MARTGNIVDNSIYQAALEGLELQKQRIEEQIKHVRALLAGKSKAVAEAPASVKSVGPKKKRKLSATAKKRIAEAQKKRWEAFRKKKEAAKG